MCFIDPEGDDAEGAENAENEKPYSRKTARKFDLTNKYHSLHGCTARRRQLDNSKENIIVRSHEAKILDRWQQRDLGYNASALTESFLCTDFELGGFDTRHSLNRSGAWEAVPVLLAEHSSAPARQLADGLQATTAWLEARGLLLPDPKVAAAHFQLQHQIFTVTGDVRPRRRAYQRKSGFWRWRTRGLQLVAQVPHEPPESVTDALLKARLSCPGYYRLPQGSIVRTDAPEKAFSVSAAAGQWLTIDLGRDHYVSAFATQGRHPETRVFPYVSHNADGWFVEGQPDWNPSDRYDGPRFTVLRTPNDPGRAKTNLAPQWVSRYELQWRSDRGREWVSLGTLRGNSDSVSEVAHLLELLPGVGKAGLVCRYLRLLPLDGEGGGGALRVGVYGRALESKPPRSKAKGRGAHSSQSEEEESANRVCYTLTTRGEHYNAKYCVDGSPSVCGRCSCSYCQPWPTLSTMRKRIAKEECAEILHEWQE